MRGRGSIVSEYCLQRIHFFFFFLWGGGGGTRASEFFFAKNPNLKMFVLLRIQIENKKKWVLGECRGAVGRLE